MEVEEAVRRVLESQSFILGPEVGQLEIEFTRLSKSEHAVGCASGSDALLLSLLALGIGPGDGVLVPALTFFATAGAVARAGARPVFVDIDPRTMTISPDSVRETLEAESSSPIPKAVIPVHLYGQCAEMDALAPIAARHRLHIIEDAAQAVLATRNTRPVGADSACACYSFYPTKNLGGAGDGGMVTTNDAGLNELLRSYRNHGSTDRRIYTHVGINSRLDTLQAAILLVKLRYLESGTAARRQRAASYRRAFAATSLASPGALYPAEDAPIVLPHEAPGSGHVYHRFTIRALRRDGLATRLRERGIESVVYYQVPLNLQPAFAATDLPAARCPESERAASEVLSLPIYPELTESQVSRIVEEIERFYSA